MPVIKKTVAIHPILDEKIRKLWAILIDNGWDATYSTALNWMILCQFLDVSKRGISKETQETLRKFLEDEATIDELKSHDYEQQLRELKIQRQQERYVT